MTFSAQFHGYSLHTEGLVIGRIPFGNTSQIVTFFTPDHGQIGCLAKGVWRPRTPLFTGPFELARVYEIVLLPRKRRSLALVIDAEERRGFLGLRHSRVALADTFFMLSVLRASSASWLPDRAGYALAVETLRRVEEGEVMSLVFIAAWLKHLGIYPNLSACVLCGKRPEEEEGWQFSFVEGGILCKKHKKPEGLPISSGLLRALKDPAGVPFGTKRYREGFLLLLNWFNELSGPGGGMVQCPFYLQGDTSNGKGIFTGIPCRKAGSPG